MTLRVVVVDIKPVRGPRLDAALRAAGFEVLATVAGGAAAHESVRRLAPDAVVIDADSPARDTLENLALLHRDSPKPTVMLAQQGTPALIRAAAQAGISLYVVEHVSPAALRSLVEVAMLHFHDRRLLAQALDDTRQTLASRRLIDRAKCLLMERAGLSEAQAYRRLRELSMNRSQPMADIARLVLRMEAAAIQ